MLAMYVTNRVFADIMVRRVGQVDIAVLDAGVYPYLEMPDASNTGPNSEAAWLSEFTRRIETTSFGLASIQILIFDSQLSNDPPSSKEHDVWHSSKVPFRSC